MAFLYKITFTFVYNNLGWLVRQHILLFNIADPNKRPSLTPISALKNSSTKQFPVHTLYVACDLKYIIQFMLKTWMSIRRVVYLVWGSSGPGVVQSGGRNVRGLILRGRQSLGSLEPGHWSRVVWAGVELSYHRIHWICQLNISLPYRIFCLTLNLSTRLIFNSVFSA